jgi:hypothetical protein
VFALDLARALGRQGPSGGHTWDASLVSLFGVDESYRAAVEDAGVGIASLRSGGSARFARAFR